MFTGIITGIGQITRIENLGASHDHGMRLHIQSPQGYLSDTGLGDSIALNGACMTVTSLAQDLFTIDISSESLNKTAGLNRLGPVNLEKALRAHDRLGGHIVSGHVDGVGEVIRFDDVGDQWKELAIAAPKALAKFLAYKGSITINGVSLTVNQVHDEADRCLFQLRLIPHTLEQTTLQWLKPGDQVNLEIDTVARYVERMLSLGSVKA
jgi:riboflavin synthase